METPQEPSEPLETSLVEVEAVEAEQEPKAARKKAKAASCDNHPSEDAVLVTTRGGRIAEQHFCERCASGLPAGYDDAR